MVLASVVKDIHTMEKNKENKKVKAKNHLNTPVTGNIVLLIKLAEWSFASPSVINFDQEVNFYKQEHPWYRKIITFGTLSLFLIIIIRYTILSTLFDPHDGQSGIILLILQMSAWTAFNTLTAVTFQKKGLTKLLNQMHNIEEKLQSAGFVPPHLVFRKYLPRILTTLVLVITVVSSVVFAYSFADASFSLRTVIATASYRGEALFLPVYLNASMVDDLFDSGCINWFLVIKGIFLQHGLLHAAFTELSGSLLVVLTCTSASALTFTFVNGLKNRKQFYPKEIVLELTEDILEMFLLIDDTLGWSIFFVCFGNLPYFASSLRDVFQGPFQAKITFTMYTFMFLWATVSGAYCNTLVNNLPTWFRIRFSQPEPTLSAIRTVGCGSKAFQDFGTDRRLDLILQEIGTLEIGIRGKLFTITFSFFGQVCGLIVTYAVLLHQLKE